MPKLNELLRRLREAGFVFECHRKKHDFYWNPKTGKRVMVWRHASKDIPNGTYNSILKDAGIND